MICLVVHDIQGRITELHEGMVSVENGVTTDFRCHPATHYVVDAEVVSRPILQVQLNGTVLSGVPAGAEILIEDQVYSADGSDIELEFGLPGYYKVQIKHWPYMDWETVIENPAQG